MVAKPMDQQGKYIDILNKIDETYKTIKAMRPIPESAVKRFREEHDILTSYYSNAIEGNNFTYDETRLLLKNGVTTTSRTMREHNDILGHSRAYMSLYTAVKENTQVTEGFIKELHSKVLQGDDYAGRYRDIDVFVGDTINVTYTAPGPERVPQLMKNYSESFSQELESNSKTMLEAKDPDWSKFFHNLAEHHIEFERIHPFVDGNGRTGRLLLNYELLRAGLIPLNIVLENRARYEAGFKSFETKAQFSSRPDSKTEGMAKLLAESEYQSMQQWLKMFDSYVNKPSAPAQKSKTIDEME